MAKTDKHQKDLKSLTGVDRLIQEPARLLILAHLSAVECADFMFLMNRTGLTRGNLSSHLAKLEEVGYVKVEKKFVGKIPRTLLRLSKRGRFALENYLQSMRTVLNTLTKRS